MKCLFYSASSSLSCTEDIMKNVHMCTSGETVEA
jgi:hypothetical protein